MKLEILFNNGTSPVHFTSANKQATPVELLVSATGSPLSRKNALQAYIRALDYVCRGVSNYASGHITNISLSKDWYGRMEKQEQSIKWDAVSDKTFIVGYQIDYEKVIENQYVADSIAVSTVNKTKVEPIWIKELFEPTAKKLTENIRNAVAIATEYCSRYSLVYSDGSLKIMNKSNREIEIDEITDDYEYILIRLLTLISGKGIHLGVFFIDCQLFSDRQIRGLLEVANVFYGDTFTFLYNLPKNSKVERETIELPNFLINN